MHENVVLLRQLLTSRIPKAKSKVCTCQWRTQGGLGVRTTTPLMHGHRDLSKSVITFARRAFPHLRELGGRDLKNS